MRVQNISFNNYSSQKANQKPTFKANVHSVVKAVCHEGDLCPPALLKLESLFIKSAIKSGKIKPENIEDLAMIKKENHCVDIILVDKTTPLYKDISELEDPKIIKQRFEVAPFDKETEEMEFSVDEKDVCPMEDDDVKSFMALLRFMKLFRD